MRGSVGFDLNTFTVLNFIVDFDWSWPLAPICFQKVLSRSILANFDICFDSHVASYSGLVDFDVESDHSVGFGSFESCQFEYQLEYFDWSVFHLRSS